MPEIMEYREGATQYVSSTLKRGDNIKLYSWLFCQFLKVW
jgi:hypothetical protein